MRPASVYLLLLSGSYAFPLPTPQTPNGYRDPHISTGWPANNYPTPNPGRPVHHDKGMGAGPVAVISLSTAAIGVGAGVGMVKAVHHFKKPPQLLAQPPSTPTLPPPTPQRQNVQPPQNQFEQPPQKPIEETLSASPFSEAALDFKNTIFPGRSTETEVENFFGRMSYEAPQGKISAAFREYETKRYVVYLHGRQTLGPKVMFVNKGGLITISDEGFNMLNGQIEKGLLRPRIL